MFGKKEKKDEFPFKFELGQRVKCPLTGFEGLVNSRSQWLHNCNTYGVKPTLLDKDGVPRKSEGFDEPGLVAVEPEKEPEVTPSRNTGGPTDEVSRTNKI